MRDIRKIVSVKKNGYSYLCVGLAFLLFIGCASMSAQEANEGVAQEAVAGSAQQKQITDIIISGASPAGPADKVLLSANSQLEYTSIKQRDPLGIVFYFPDTILGQIQSQYTPDSNIIASVKTAMSPDQKSVKVEVVLKKDSSYDVKRSGNNMEISFASKAAPALVETPIADTSSAAKTKAIDTGDRPIDASPKELAMKGPAKESKPQASKVTSSAAPSVIDRIDFLNEESGKSSVIVGTSIPVDYELNKISDRTLKLRIFNSRLPESRRQRPLITTRFQSAVDKISPVQAADTNATDIIIELRELTPYRPVQEGNVITVYFDPSSVGPKPLETGQLPEWQQALASSAAPTSTPAAESVTKPAEQPKPVVQSALDPSEESPVVAEETLPYELQEKKVYTGQKIALDFYMTDIKNVFRILQQISGKNYAVDKEVNGEVTISIEKPVPWDQVLDLILQMNGLGKKEQGDIVRIATVAKLQQEEKERADKIVAIRKREEATKLLDPIETEFIPISYASAAKEVVPQLEELIFGGKAKAGKMGVTSEGVRGKIDVDSRNNQVIIHSTRNIIEKCKEIIKEIDKVTPQVLIEARIIEASETYKRELGISWVASGEDIYRSDINGMYSYNVAMNTPNTSTANNTIGLNFTRLDAWGTPIVLDAALKAMEEQGEGKIISSPKILTLDNKVALIKQGERVPYEEKTNEGVSTTKFLDVVLSLEVTPHMTPDSRVALRVKTTKNELIEFTDAGQPRTTVNEAETELLVDNGETIVLGGVVRATVNESEAGFPILKDIPLLGWMFKTNTNEATKRELLIFMSPRIVQLEQKNLVQSEQ